LSFGRGVSAEEETELWARDLTGAIDTWIEVGQPDEKSIRQACGRAKRVYVYTYGGRGADQWWEKNLAALDRLNNLTVTNLPLEGSRALAQLAQPTMQWHCTIQERQIWIADGVDNIHMNILVLKHASEPFGR
jgi:uncharacterized protein YaeQ